VPAATRPQFTAQGAPGPSIERGPYRWSRPRAVSAGRQDTRVGGTPQSVRASRRQLGLHLAPQPGIQECAGSPGLTGSGGRLDLRRTGAIGVALRRVAAQYPRHRSERMAVRQAQNHGLQHSSARSIVLAWQHRSPSGPVVLHLELELKESVLVMPNV
jgi:hypothetical protein